MKQHAKSSPSDEAVESITTTNNSTSYTQIITTKSSGKKYRVTVRFRDVSEEEAQSKKAMIESILKSPDK